MRNIQRRTIGASADRVGVLLDGLSGPGDVVWPVPAWAPLRFDAGLTAGSSGGHGRVRYSVSEVEPGRRIRCTFAPGLGLVGDHEFRVRPDGPDRCEVVHELVARTEGRMVLFWPLVLRPLHDALLQDLLDNLERAATGRLPRPARWSPLVRLLRRAFVRV
ncbi:SRPBCC family protein [Kitasatospora sp. NPDC002040]|uniref:SRPBCC family protein n=1 Tax=Kitasatospora sp. NPDC002040 TaxID=3154661 RepID=UPI003333D428